MLSAPRHADPFVPYAADRLLFSGQFTAPYRDAALEAVGRLMDAGARDILFIAASGQARRAAVSDLVARRGAVFGFRAVTVGSVPRELARRARQLPPDRLDPVVDELLVERAIRGACGDRFSSRAPIPGITAKVAAVIDLLERNNATPDSLDAALAELEVTGDGPTMLSCAWRALSLARTGRGHTRAAIARFAVELVKQQPRLLAGCDVMVLEDLPLASPLDRALVAAIVATAPGTVIAAHGTVPQLALAPASIALGQLRAMAAWNETASVPAASQYAAALERIFVHQPASGNGKPAEAGPLGVAITRLDAAGEVGEVRLAARVVRRHLRAGTRPSDIRIVVHSRGRYHDLIEEIFRGAGIPAAVELPCSVAMTGIGRAVLHLVDIATSTDGASIDASLALVRMPHLDVSAEGADRLHRHVVTRGRLGLEDWHALSSKILGKRTVNRVNRLRRALDRARKGFAAAQTPEACAQVVRRMARDLRLVGNAFFSRRRLAAMSGAAGIRAGADVAVRADNGAWESVEEALDVTIPAMTRAHRGSGPFVQEWARMLRRAFDSAPAPREVAPADAVSVSGSGPGMNRQAGVVIVLGLLERSFPRATRQDPLLKDDLRRELRRLRGWELPVSEAAADAERECFVRTISTATKALYLSSAATDAAGKPAVKSFFIDDLQRAMGPAHPIAVERAGAADGVPIEEAGTPTELLTAVAHDLWQHLPRSSGHRRTAAFAAYEAMRTRGMDLSALTHGRDPVQQPVFQDGVLRRAPHTTLRLSASQLKSIGHCTYMHFIQKVLDPKEIAAPSYDALVKGSLIHDAMVEWADSLKGWKRGVAALPELQDWFEAKVSAWPPAQQSNLAQYSAQVHWGRLESLLTAELAALASAGVAQPMFHEIAFGEELNATGRRDPASRVETFDLALPLATGETVVRFRGSLDRVDVVEIDGKRYGVVLDYKTGESSKFYADEMAKGYDLQLRLYMLALREFWGIEPIAALFLGFGDGVRRGVVREQFASRVAGLDRDAVELIGEERWASFVDRETTQLIVPLVDRLARRDITPSPRDRDCGFCNFQPICRYDPFAREAANA